MALSERHPRLLIRQENPLNAGPAPDVLLDSFATPNELFFVRNHGNVPAVDPAAWRLTVDGLVERPLSLSLADLQRLPRLTVAATLQCAGNRRLEMMAVSPIPNELPWGTEAISNAEWSGVPLREVLATAGPRSGALHAAFLGLDDAERHGHRFHFGGSIPLAKAMHPEVLLADTMNGEPLPAAHGAPLRVVVSGYIGARSVKWLSRITLQEQPSDNYFQAKAYRLFPPSIGPENVDWETGMMLGESPVNSVICSPLEGGTLATGDGAGLGGGGRGSGGSPGGRLGGWRPDLEDRGSRRRGRLDVALLGGAARPRPGLARDLLPRLRQRRADPAQRSRAGLELQGIREQRLAPGAGGGGVGGRAGRRDSKRLAGWSDPPSESSPPGPLSTEWRGGNNPSRGLSLSISRPPSPLRGEGPRVRPRRAGRPDGRGG